MNAFTSKNWRATAPAPPATAQTPKKSVLEAKSVRPGLIARLPRVSTIPSDSIFFQQEWMKNNDGAGNHFVVIVDTSDIGDRVTACLCTAWHDEATRQARTIQTKYPKETHPCRHQYLAIDQKNQTAPHNGLPVIRLAKDQQFASQTYVGVGRFFDIETAYLDVAYESRKSLDEKSLGQLTKHLIDYHDNKMPSYSEIPGVASPRKLGRKPNLSAGARQRAFDVDNATPWKALSTRQTLGKSSWRRQSGGLPSRVPSQSCGVNKAAKRLSSSASPAAVTQPASSRKSQPIKADYNWRGPGGATRAGA